MGIATVLVLFEVVVGDLAQGPVARCAVTIVVSRETTRRLYHLRRHGWVRQDHPDAPLGGTVAFPGTRCYGNGGARRSAGCPEDPSHPAGFGQPGTESDHRDPALFRLACAKRGRVDPAGVGARRNRA